MTTGHGREIYDGSPSASRVSYPAPDSSSHAGPGPGVGMEAWPVEQTGKRAARCSTAAGSGSRAAAGALLPVIWVTQLRPAAMDTRHIGAHGDIISRDDVIRWVTSPTSRRPPIWRRICQPSARVAISLGAGSPTLYRTAIKDIWLAALSNVK